MSDFQPSSYCAMGPEVWYTFHYHWVAGCTGCEAQTGAWRKNFLLCYQWTRKDTLWSWYGSAWQSRCKCMSQIVPLPFLLILVIGKHLWLSMMPCRRARLALGWETSGTLWKRLRTSGGADCWNRRGSLLSFWKLTGRNGLMKMRSRIRNVSVSRFLTK